VDGEERLPGDERLARFSLTFAKKAKDPGAVLESAVSELVNLGFGVREASPVRATLEQVFAELTRAELREAEETATEEESADQEDEDE